MKNSDILIKEYVRNLMDEDVRFLFSRYSQMLFGDRAEIVEFLSQKRDIDRWLQSASSSFELFNMVDQVGENIQKEYARRFDKNKD